MSEIISENRPIIGVPTNSKISFNEETIRAIFGHEAAEDESVDRLKQYYVKTEIYESMKSKVPLLLLVGHKGIGKSALLKVLSVEDEYAGRLPIDVRPNDIVKVSLGESNFLVKIEMWKDGLSSIILNKLIASVSQIKSLEPKNTALLSWMDRFSQLLLSSFGKKIEELQNEHISLSSAQFTSLLKNVLFSEKEIIIYLDDLDRGWENTRDDIKDLSAMINAIRDLSRDMKNLRFRVALRSDVYYSVRTSDETTDKIDGSVIWQSWTNHQILVMLIKRIETYFGREVDIDYLIRQSPGNIAYYLDSVFESRFHGSGHWENATMCSVIMSLVRKRPRDAVKICTLAARKAFSHGHNLIYTKDIEDIFMTYSNDRLTDTTTEYKSELPNMQDLLLKMKPSTKDIRETPCLFTREQLLVKLKNIISMSRFTFKDGRVATSQDLAAFLYKINFITARKMYGDKILRVYYDENQYICNNFVDFGFSYEIHPAFRWALQPTSISSLYRQIQLLDLEFEKDFSTPKAT